ncbi:hypothetical protein DESC_720083 [Desulfosarcina cetonica]|nr:hypothetical protein DESC_720083 [Desulfosarcina cetonica]
MDQRSIKPLHALQGELMGLVIEVGHTGPGYPNRVIPVGQPAHRVHDADGGAHPHHLDRVGTISGKDRVEIGAIKTAVAGFGNHPFGGKRSEIVDHLAAPGAGHAMPGKFFKFQVIGRMGVLEINHQAARLPVGRQALADEGNDLPGARTAVQRTFFVDKIVEHVNDDQCGFGHNPLPFRVMS